MMKLTFLLALLLSFFTEYARGEILVEPYYGVSRSSGDGDSDGDGVNDTVVDWTGSSYGMRLGVSMAGLSVGGQYDQFSMGQDTTQPLMIDYKGGGYGVFVGYSFPVLFKFYLTLFLNAELEIDKLNGEAAPILRLIGLGEGSKFEGSAFALGFGFTSIPFLDLFIEFRKYSWDTFIPASGESTSSSADTGLLVFGVSIPI
jgi:hypothetical protein